MDILLNEIEARIVGVLIEKQMATPDYYPLTLNALVNACNQSTNRDPVMHLDHAAVEEALVRLRNDRLVFQVKTQGSRSLKYEHNMKDVADFSDRELAIVCILLLRGPQTAGELRSRTGRLAEFHGVAAVEHILQKLAGHEAGPFVRRLDRRPGQKENRYAHTFGKVAEPSVEDAPPRTVMPVAPLEGADRDRMALLEKKVDDLAEALEDLKARFYEFKGQFED
ncbi:MAG: YceH family protein [Desulfobacteraceae bacterium]|jgi:hypothetical protein